MVQKKTGSRRRRKGLGARHIYKALKEQILGGAFGADGLLPSSRAQAAELAVSRATVTAAHEQLAAEGFIDIRPGARARVAISIVQREDTARKIPAAPPENLAAFGRRLVALTSPAREAPRKLVADFHYGDLAGADFPTLAWKRGVVDSINRQGARLSYDHPSGTRRLRTALQQYLWRARMVRCEIDQIVVVNGSQQGLDLCARLLLDAGDRFVVENPCYATARQTFAATGATAVPVSVDESGLLTSRLASIDARLAYVTPSHQFPMGGIMPIGRRRELLAWGQRADAYIIEDDYDSEYRYDISPVPSLYGLGDGGNVIYLGTISKTLSPTLRIGYLVVPPQLSDVFSAAKYLSDRHTSLLAQDALATLLESGLYERHIRAVRRRNGKRRAALLEALAKEFGDTVTVQGADAGLHVIVWLPHLPNVSEEEVIAKAGAMGLGIHPLSPSYDPREKRARAARIALLMGYASMDTAHIKRGVRLLGRVLESLTS